MTKNEIRQKLKIISVDKKWIVEFYCGYCNNIIGAFLWNSHWSSNQGFNEMYDRLLICPICFKEIPPLKMKITEAKPIKYYEKRKSIG